MMYFQVNITAPGGARAAELHQAWTQDPLNTNGNTTAVLWGPHDPHQDKVNCLGCLLACMHASLHACMHGSG